MSENEQSTTNPETTRTDKTVRDTIARAVAARRLTEAQGETLFWLHGYGVDNRLSDGLLSEQTGISKTTISQLFSGKYAAADWTSVIKRVEIFKRKSDAAARKMDVGFVLTETAQIIFKVCDNAVNDGMPAFIYGASQLGKTRSLEEYVRANNTTNVKYLRFGSNWTKSRLVRELGDACHVRGVENKTTAAIERDIRGSLSHTSLLIVDEFHLAMETVSSDTSRSLVEYIREVYDRTKCGLVLCSTKVGLADLEEGRNKMLFDQLRRRGVLKVVLPDVPSVRDLNQIARSFGLPNASGDALATVKMLVKVRGLGVFFKYLEKATAILAEQNEKRTKDGGDAVAIDWPLFLSVNSGYNRLSNMETEY